MFLLKAALQAYVRKVTAQLKIVLNCLTGATTVICEHSKARIRREMRQGCRLKGLVGRKNTKSCEKERPLIFHTW